MMQYLVLLRFSGLSAPELRKTKCENYASIFMLVGNPGIVWHPATGQCMRSQMRTEAMSGEEPNGKEI